jgi:two-component system phosphate regulon sensor histidine kinase PhoR
VQARPELEDLKRRQREQSEAMMMLVHELRSPVTTCKSMVAGLRYLKRDDAELDHFLSRIEYRMESLLELVNDLLDLSEAKAGQPHGQAVRLDLVERTSAICEPYREEADVKGLALEMNLPQSPVWVRMTERAYHLIVSNLVSNAVKYTPVGSVRVVLRVREHWAVLEVQDDGIGIPEDEMPKLCTEFYRASNARYSQFQGTGLGLAGVKALVDGCGGDLEISSQEGEGSRFRVRLPLLRRKNPSQIRSNL